VQQIPVHSHAMLASTSSGSSSNPQSQVLATPVASIYETAPAGGTIVGMNSAAIGPAGGSQPHENMQPFLVINFIISLFGIFPSQT
jgi:microcystin-dependent protein